MADSWNEIFTPSSGNTNVASPAPSSPSAISSWGDVFNSSPKAPAAPAVPIAKDPQVKSLVANTPLPTDTSSFFAKSSKLFSNIVSLPGKAIQGAGNLLEKSFGPNIEAGLAMSDETGAEKVLKPAAALVGGSSPENLPLGVGDVIKGYKDIYQHPEDYAPVTFDDFLTGLAETGKQVDRGLIKMPLNFAGVPIKFNLPYIGEVTNRQFDASKRIADGENPLAVTAEEGIGSVFDTLMLAGMISEVTGPRQVVTNSVEVTPEDALNNPAIKNMPEGAKSFRLFNPVTAAQPIPPGMVERMINEKGFNPGEDYDPKLPTFFKGTGQANGNVKFEVVQIKPSILNSMSDYFSKNTSAGYETTQKNLLSSGHDFDRAIEAGDMPVEKVYNSDGTLVPQQADHAVSDLAGKLDEYKPGLGAQFKKSVDLTAPTPTSLMNQASALLTKVAGGNTGLNNPLYLPSLSNKKIDALPKKDVSVIKTQTVNPKEVAKAPNEITPPLKVHPTLAKEVGEHIAKHGEDLTHQALQDKFGMPPSQATHVINSIKQTPAMENPAQAAETGKISLEDTFHQPPEISDHITGEKRDIMEALAEKGIGGTFFEDLSLEQLRQEAKDHGVDPANISSFKSILVDKKIPATDKSTATGYNRLQPYPDEKPTKPVRIGPKKKLSGKALEHISYHTEAIEQLKQQIAEHPGTAMKKFVDKKTGQFEDFKNPDIVDSKTGKLKYSPVQRARIQARNEKIMRASESAFEDRNSANPSESSEHDNPDAIREAIAESSNMQESLKYHQEAMKNAKNEIFPEENSLTKIIESTPESKKISEGVSTNFEYNPESGFVTTAPIAKAVTDVEDFIKATKKGTKAAGNLDDSLYILTKANEADRILATKLAKKIDITPADAEAIYHYEEDKSLPLTDHQRQVYEDSIKPLAEASAKIANKLKEIIPLDAEGYTPRFVAGRGNVIDRIKAGAQGIGGKGSVLGKTAPSLKRRTMKAIVNPDGSRSVVSLKDGKIVKMEGKKPKIIGYYSSAKDLSSGKYYKNIKDMIDKKPVPEPLNIQEATTKEIEANTNLTYHKNVFVNRLVSYLNLRQVERATDFLDAYKASPEFGSIGMKFGEGEAPKSWTTTVNPSFRGYMLDPRVANVMDKYASNMVKGKDPLRALTSLNGFLRTAIFFNPLIHIPNIGIHWLVNRGTAKFVNPKAYLRLGKTSARAINAVLHQNQDYIDMLNSGAPLLYSSQETRNMHNLLLGKMTNEIDKNPNLDFLKKAMKSINPYVLSGKATWMINDVATMQAIYEEMETKDVTMEQAIKDVGSHIPNYRVPAGKIMQLLSNPNITMFGAYHYGALRSYYEMAKTLATGATQGRVPYALNKKTGSYERTYGGKEANKNRAEVLDKLLMMGIIALVIYPAIDKALQKATGNPNAKIRRAGALTFPYNLAQVAAGTQDISQFIQSVITPAVGSKELISQMFNLDLFTGQHIRDTGATAGEEFKEAVSHAVKAVAPVAQYQKVSSGAQTPTQFLESLAGISDPDKGRVSLSNSIASAQAKVDKLDKATVARVKTTYDQAKAAGFGTPEADALVANLSDSDYTVYKDLKAVDTAQHQLDLADKIEPLVIKAHDLGFGSAEADKIVENFTDEEMTAYTKIKKALYSTSDTTMSGTPKVWDQQSLIDHISTYAKAIGEHPIQLFNDILAGNQSYRIVGNENGQLMVERLDEKNSQAIKKRLGGATKDFKLDHTIPLEVGGNNSDSNLQLLTTDQWASNTDTENALGKALKAGKITGPQAREYIIRFKKGLGETMSPDLEKEYKDKYGATPLTKDEINSLIE